MGPSTAVVLGGATWDTVRQRVVRVDGGMVSVLTTTPAGGSRHGSGCALGPAPAMNMVGWPTPGAEVVLDVHDVTAGLPVLCGIGIERPGIHLGSGCFLFLDAGAVLLAATTGAGGAARFPLLVPPSPGLRGTALLAQAAVVDPARGLFGPLTLTSGCGSQSGTSRRCRRCQRRCVSTACARPSRRSTPTSPRQSVHMVRPKKLWPAPGRAP